MGVTTAPKLRDRYDRSVRRMRLYTSPGAPHRRLAFSVEEALRLASLPGENEGRSYYFQQVRMAGLPAAADRRVWLETFQCALSQQAARAIHGADPRAASASAVFFRSEQEALEILLHRILARRRIHEWFWPMVVVSPGDGPSASSSMARPQALDARMIPAIVERLRTGPASWTAVAAALFTTSSLDALSLLAAVPIAAAEKWLLEMEGSAPAASGMVPGILPPVRHSVEQAMRVAGFDDVRTLWLATLAILAESPARLANGAAVRYARTMLQKLSLTKNAGPAERNSLKQATFTSAIESGLSPNDSSVTVDHSRLTGIGLSPRRTATQPSSDEFPGSEISAPSQVAAFNSSSVVAPSNQSSRRNAALSNPGTPPEFVAADYITSTAPWFCEGLPTSAAGLFFMLNPLREIGIAEAFSAGLSDIYPNFAIELLRRLAAQARVAPDDPVRLWLESLATPTPDLESLGCAAAWFPSNLRPSRTTASADYLLRVWYLAARRWCWIVGKLTLPRIIFRTGVFSVSRTDLDVSMPLDDAEVRVRVVGLDFDPGWLPWFGRVVRFHYLDRGEFGG